MNKASLKIFFTTLASAAGVLGIIYVGLVLVLKQEWVDENASLVFTHGLYWLLIPPIFMVIWYSEKNTSSFYSPEIKQVLDNGLLIVEPCEWLGYRTVVSIFRVQDDVELFEFSALVVNIQTNKLVQLEPIIQEEASVDPSRIRGIKERLLIKPGVIL